MFVAVRQRELAQEREALRARCATLRNETSTRATVLLPPLRMADAVWRAWRWLRSHPEAVAVTAVVVAAMRPRRAWALVRLAWRGWRTWRRLGGLVAAMQDGYAQMSQRFQTP